MDLAAFKRLEKMPTKIELIATIARLLNQVYTLPALHALSALHSIDTTMVSCKSCCLCWRVCCQQSLECTFSGICCMLQVPTKIAVSIKQVPTKVVYGVKALADGDDNKDAIVSDIFPKPATEQQA